MSTYYVATRIRYVLVEADCETNARTIGDAALHEMHDDLGKRLGHEVPFEIRSVRLATTNEIEFMRWTHEDVAVAN
jgi:hypothetical protein